jgi:hypothetical protein
MCQNKNGYYITYDKPNERVILKPDKNLVLNDSHLIELVLPEGDCVESVICQNNQLERLTIPMGYNYVNCSNNLLTELITNDIKQLNCSDNYLKELTVTHCLFLDCYFNKLTKLIVNKNCKQIYCNTNKLPKIIVELFQSLNPVKIALANNMQLANSLQVTNSLQVANMQLANNLQKNL